MVDKGPVRYILMQPYRIRERLPRHESKSFNPSALSFAIRVLHVAVGRSRFVLCIKLVLFGAFFYLKKQGQAFFYLHNFIYTNSDARSISNHLCI